MKNPQALRESSELVDWSIDQDGKELVNELLYKASKVV